MKAGRPGRWLYLILLAGAMSEGPLEAQVLRGWVYEVTPPGPVPFAQAQLLDADGTLRSTTTADMTGRFDLRVPLPGRYTLRAWSLGTDTLTVSPIELNPSDTVTLKVYLETRPVAISGISVTVRQMVGTLARTGFYERAATNPGGVFIPPEELVRRLHGNATDALEGVPGLQLDESSGPSQRIPFISRGSAFARHNPKSAYCVPAIYLDGALVQPGDAVPGQVFGFDSIEPSSLLGVEIYRSPSEVPAQYSGGTTACGVVVVWTR